MSDFAAPWRTKSAGEIVTLLHEEIEFKKAEAVGDPTVTAMQASTVIDEEVERAYMQAEQFIELCGFDLGDSDTVGDSYGGAVRDALTFAFLRLGVDAVNEAL